MDPGDILGGEEMDPGDGYLTDAHGGRTADG